MTQVIESNTAPASIKQRKHNQKHATTFGADILKYAKNKREADTSGIYMVHAHEPDLIELDIQVTRAQKAGDSVREVMLSYWYKTAEGIKHIKAKSSLPKAKQRTEKQDGTFAELGRLESAINLQLIRALDTYRGVAVLRKTRLVHIEKIDLTSVYTCFVRSSATDAKGKPIEFTNTRFAANDLQHVAAVEKQFTAATPTATILKLCGSKKKATPNKGKGGNVEALPVAHIGKTLQQLDTALSPLAMQGKIEGVSKQTRESAHALWARLDAAMTSEEKDAARVAFKSLAAKPEKAKRKAA